MICVHRGHRRDCSDISLAFVVVPSAVRYTCPYEQTLEAEFMRALRYYGPVDQRLQTYAAVFFVLGVPNFFQVNSIDARILAGFQVSYR